MSKINNEDLYNLTNNIALVGGNGVKTLVGGQSFSGKFIGITALERSVIYADLVPEKGDDSFSGELPEGITITSIYKNIQVQSGRVYITLL